MINESVAQRLANASPIPKWFCYTHFAECGVSESNGQAHNLKICSVASDHSLDHALDQMTCSLANWASSICFQQNGIWKEIGGVIIEMLVSVPHTRLWWFLFTLQVQFSFSFGVQSCSHDVDDEIWHIHHNHSYVFIINVHLNHGINRIRWIYHCKSTLTIFLELQQRSWKWPITSEIIKSVTYVHWIKVNKANY